MSSFFQRLRYYILILSDRQTPWYVKLILVVALLYLLLPMDFLVDTIPFIGWIDDLAIAAFAVAMALRFVPAEVITRVQKRIFRRKP